MKKRWRDRFKGRRLMRMQRGRMEQWAIGLGVTRPRHCSCGRCTRPYWINFSLQVGRRGWCVNLLASQRKPGEVIARIAIGGLLIPRRPGQPSAN